MKRKTTAKTKPTRSKSPRKPEVKKPKPTATKPAKAKTATKPAKPKAATKPAKAKRGAKRLRATPWGRQPAVRAHWAATAAVHDEMTASLAAGRGDEGRERAAFAHAIECYMGLDIDNTPEDPREAMCMEFLWEGGNGGVPGVIERAGEVDRETHDRWFRLLIEEEGAFRRRRGIA